MVLLTAFKGKGNSSKLLLDKISGKNITKKFLTNSFDACEREIMRYISEDSPEYIISFGRKPLINRLCVETAACHDGLRIGTNFDISFLKAVFARYEIPFEVSDNAGNYLCNHVYYKGLEILKQSMSESKMIFIHVPDMKRFQNIDIVASCLSELCEELVAEEKSLSRIFLRPVADAQER